jgi:hypothetical protein
MTLCLAVLLSAVPAIAADIHTFNLLPAGSIAGPAGSTIGWGYSIENQSSSLWLVTSGLDNGVFQHGTPGLIFDFPDVAPGETVTVPFSNATSAGLYELTWDASAPLGFVNHGSFVLQAEWWNGDPLGGGSFVSSASYVSQFYSATVAPVPEPTTAGLVAFSILLLLVIRWRFGSPAQPAAGGMKPGVIR